MSTPPALTLPDELWLDILGDFALKYIDVKHVSRVSKYFNKLEKDSQLDSIMFRKAPTAPKLEKAATPVIHPLLDATFMVWVGSEVAEVWYWEADKKYNAYDYETVNEFATYPSSTQVDIDLLAFRAKLTNPQGVTVKAVLQKVAEKWEEKVVGYGEIVTRREALYDHNGWTGWEPVVVTASGGVKLSTSSYDS